MDPLKQVLQAMRLEPQIFHRMEQYTPWGIEFSIQNGAAIHVVETGNCWLRLEDGSKPMRLLTGDIVVVSNAQKYEISGDLSSASITLDDWLKQPKTEPVSHNTCLDIADATTLLCSILRPYHGTVHPLFSLLPPLIYIKNIEGRPIEWLAMPLDNISSEAQTQYPGYETVISRLLDILFIMVIRYWITHQTPDEGGWLGALYHPQIGKVLNRLHSELAHQWTITELAEIALMSRSAFSAQFSKVVGESPMQYLTRWRMQLAANALIDNPMASVEYIASQFGYTSAFAFSKTFKRVFGLAPSKYRGKYAS
ncbi:MAG: helix-turn-helix domain-containing protein [Anaerolineaceae bacterium]|nr:helix-turn-helix domain-containing protein [Anaerolineaceae bacterium]